MLNAGMKLVIEHYIFKSLILLKKVVTALVLALSMYFTLNFIHDEFPVLGGLLPVFILRA